MRALDNGALEAPGRVINSESHAHRQVTPSRGLDSCMAVAISIGNDGGSSVVQVCSLIWKSEFLDEMLQGESNAEERSVNRRVMQGTKLGVSTRLGKRRLLARHFQKRNPSNGNHPPIEQVKSFQRKQTSLQNGSLCSLAQSNSIQSKNNSDVFPYIDFTHL